MTAVDDRLATATSIFRDASPKRRAPGFGAPIGEDTYDEKSHDMPWKSSTERYGTMAITIHWISAVALLGLVASGFLASGSTDPTTESDLLRVHVVLGVSVLVLTVLRIVWWGLIDRSPPAPVTTPQWDARLAHSVHILMYVVILAIAASGIALLMLSGTATQLLSGTPGALPDFAGYAPMMLHRIGAWALIALTLGHIGAALFHQLVLRERTLARIGLGR
ncbi:cytochrome b [Nocardiopsis terrae]